MAQSFEWYLLLTATVVNAFLIAIWAYIIKSYKTKKTFAILLRKGKEKPKIVKIDTTQSTFDYNKRTYNIIEPTIKHGNERYLIYDVKGADPIDPLSKSNSRMDSETYHNILKNKALIALNTVPMSLDFENPYVKWGLLIVGGILAVTVFG